MSAQTPSIPSVSVIIPTYNRKDSLLRTLDSLSRQTYPADRFEVIVVDDGGTDGTEALVQGPWPFAFRYLRQENQGAAVARNTGAANSQGALLVFADDDITFDEITLSGLVDDLTARVQTIVLGQLRLPYQIVENSPFAKAGSLGTDRVNDGEFVPFQKCMTGLLAIWRSDFRRLGMFQDPTGGWPNWDDVDFGYRASQAGYRFWRSVNAGAEHWDYSVSDLRNACNRWYRASNAAPRLFEKHSALRASIPMFWDKGPIQWQQDLPPLIARKIARQIASSRPVMFVMERAVPFLERRAPESKLLVLFYRWIVSGYIYRGYREGLRARSALSGGN